MKKIKLELFMNFESYVKGFIDYHEFIGNSANVNFETYT